MSSLSITLLPAFTVVLTEADVAMSVNPRISASVGGSAGKRAAADVDGLISCPNVLHCVI